MKKIILAVALSSISSLALASDPSTTNTEHSQFANTSFNIGYAQLTAPELRDAGFKGKFGGLSLNVKSQINDYVAFRSTFEYMRLSEEAVSIYNYSTSTLKSTTVRGGGAFLIGTTFYDDSLTLRPYIVAGIGYQSISSSAFGYSNSDGTPYGQLGLGVEVQISHAVLNLAYTKDGYSDEDFDNTSTIEATIGYKF
ncbi:hypothetical protein VHA01S_021_00170 [Vibrio halioticoli NBRC 102217]|uniref:Outer membrane protein beta-barrel domain-containing protein n=1 Tax=Vibrio halioticoli NBRC 102217 TaxID=1219072 RepID=V5FD75_9VIBR|nr:outer membrane beta-barrel protein [Vibrio halioticoli]GAD89523.1 hypothetical protein VHA01S_021_00170 [Vibrio halioticoli NBRC 102217]